MRMVSAIASQEEPGRIIGELTQQLRQGLEGDPADLLLLFVSTALQKHFGGITGQIGRQLGARSMLACTAESVLGGGREIERQAAVSAMAISLPGVTIGPFRFAEEEWPELMGEGKALRARLETGPDLRLLLMFGDPFTTPVVQLLDACSREFPHAPIVGGMASGMMRPGETRLAIGDNIFSSGLIGVSYAGPLEVDCVVSQGCRPIGKTFIITRGHDNIIEELDHEPALRTLRKMIDQLPPADRDLMEQRGLQIGRVIDERKGNFGRGDFLVRNILGIHRPSHGLSIGDMVQSGQIVQFQVQDARTANEDLRLLLEGELLLSNAPRGALMFSCNGRGTHLFQTPNHDIQALGDILGPIPVAGFFCAGELGPVGGRNFIHGQTVSLALFR